MFSSNGNASEHVRDNHHGTDSCTSRCERLMSTPSEDIPTMQRLYNRIWLLAAAAMVFFIVVYVGWGLLDILSLPVGPR